MIKRIAALLVVSSIVHAAPEKQNELQMVFPGTSWYQVERVWTSERPNTEIVCTSAMGRTCTVPNAGEYKWLHEGEKGVIGMNGQGVGTYPPGGVIISDRVSCDDTQQVIAGVSTATCELTCPAGEILTAVSCNSQFRPGAESLSLPNPTTLNYSGDSGSAACFAAIQSNQPGLLGVSASGACLSLP